MAQHEAGCDAVEFIDQPNVVLLLKEHTDAARRFQHVLEYMEAIRTGKASPGLVTSHSLDELPT